MPTSFSSSVRVPVHSRFVLLLTGIRQNRYPSRKTRSRTQSFEIVSYICRDAEADIYSTSSLSITSYGDRPNEYDSIIRYFRAHFESVHSKNNENRRTLFTHLSSAIVSLASFLCLTFPVDITRRIRKRPSVLSPMVRNRIIMFELDELIEHLYTVREFIFTGYLRTVALV
jgi:hypothetical protein